MIASSFSIAFFRVAGDIQSSVCRPDYEAAHVEMGAMYGTQRDWKDAVAELKKAVALDPSDTDAHNELAKSLEQYGQPHEASGSRAAAPAN